MTCNVGAPGMVLAVWVAAGPSRLAGALTYAELAAMMPRAGGEYVFIREAYGPVRLPLRLDAVLRRELRRPGRARGRVRDLPERCGRFTRRVPLALPGGPLASRGLQMAFAAILLVTLINCAAVAVGGRIAVALTRAKVGAGSGRGLGRVLLAAATGRTSRWRAGGTCEGVAAAARGGVAGFGAAMLGALWAYNGWNEVTYVAGEVKDPHRNLPRAIIGGIADRGASTSSPTPPTSTCCRRSAVASVPASSTVATEVVTSFLGGGAARLMAAALAVSVFGALQSPRW